VRLCKSCFETHSSRCTRAADALPQYRRVPEARANEEARRSEILRQGSAAEDAQASADARAAAVHAAEERRKVEEAYKVGERVQCRERGDDDWQDGVVVSIDDGQVKVQPDGWPEGHTWDEVRKHLEHRVEEPPAPKPEALAAVPANPEPSLTAEDSPEVSTAGDKVVQECDTSQIAAADEGVVGVNTSISMGDREVMVVAESCSAIDTALASKQFTEWAATMAKSKRIEISKIDVQSVDMTSSRLLSARCKVDGKRDGRDISKVVFMCGGAPSVLVVLKFTKDKNHFVLTVRQPRLPAANSALQEIVTGMLDDDGNLIGKPAKVIHERAGIEINESELINMTQMAQGIEYPGMYTSTVQSDEYHPLFLCRKHVCNMDLASLKGRIAETTSTDVQLEITPFNQLWRMTPDAKALSALCLHDKLVADGRLPDF
jgi:hypothetical protein